MFPSLASPETGLAVTRLAVGKSWNRRSSAPVPHLLLPVPTPSMSRGVSAAKEPAVQSSSCFFRLAVFTAINAFVFAAPACADDAPSDASPTDLDQVVVTATRTAQTQDQTLAAITVIDRAEIERLQPLSIVDLLQGTPGMSIANNGGPGKNTSLFLRGTESDHVLILVDGLKLGAATSGTAAIQDIPVDQIERIEIVRGPFSSLYGSEALGGVIQIFTRRPQGSFVPNFSAGIGSNASERASAGVAGRGESGWYSVEASHEQTDGINACKVGAAEAFAGCFTDEPDRDGYRNSALSLQGGYRFSDAWDADLRAFRAEGNSHYDGSFSNESDTASQVIGGSLHYRPNSSIALTLGLGQSADLAKDYLNSVYTDTFNTHRDLGTLQGDFAIGPGLLSIGYDWQRDRVDSNTEFAVDERDNNGVFAQWQQSFGAQSLQASVRHDDNEQFGGKTTGSVLWGWDFTQSLRVTASAGTAYKAPTFNDLYYPGYGNPDLRPENSRNVELGLRGKQDWGGWSLNAFQNTVDDLIAYDAAIELPGNVDHARIRGVEAAADTTFADWTLRGSATWLDPRNEGTDSGNILPRRARLSARVDLDRSFGAFSIGGSVYAADKRYDDLANTRVLGGYALTDLRVAYVLSPAWKLQLAANNLFDRSYETAAFYNQLGRNYMLTVRYQPVN
jgi:vitamin B12 transporter